MITCESIVFLMKGVCVYHCPLLSDSMGVSHDRSCPWLGRQLFSNLSERLSSALVPHLMELSQQHLKDISRLTITPGTQRGPEIVGLRNTAKC